ncbi:MAG: hypothetical protein AAF664_15485 [Planctomycetota bacterium]
MTNESLSTSELAKAALNQKARYRVEGSEEDFERVEPMPVKARRRSRRWLVVVSVAMGLFIVFCIGLVTRQSEVATGQVRGLIEHHPTVIKHIGSLQSFDLDMERTAELSRGGERQRLAFDIIGDSGAGKIVIEQNLVRINDFEVESAVMTLADGTVHTLTGPSDHENVLDHGGS